MSHELASLKLRKLLDHTVKDAHGEKLGRIDDIIVNARDGRIEFLRLAVDSAGNSGTHLITIPWSQLKWVDVNIDLTLEVSSDTLRRLADVQL